MDRGSQLDEDDEDDEDDEEDEEDDEEEEDEERRGGGGGGGREEEEKATNIKSNNPHLAGGELSFDMLQLSLTYASYAVAQQSHQVTPDPTRFMRS